MVFFLEVLLYVHNWWHGVPKIKKQIHKESTPLRLGVLSAATINYTAIFEPVESHPGVVLSALAARSLSKAQAQIAKYKLKPARAYGSYDEVLADADIDAVYIPLPNGLHFEWAVKSLKAGKHVLLEKPFTSNAEKAEKLRQYSLETGKICLEAFHWRFHPAAHTAKSIITSRKFGNVLSINAKMLIPAGTIGLDDIRFKYPLAGGACMDLTYVFSAATYFATPSMESTGYKVLKAEPRINKKDSKVDDAMHAEFTISSPNTDSPDVHCTTNCDLTQSKLFGLIPRFWDSAPTCTIELEKASIHFDNFAAPYITHGVTITEKAVDGKVTGKKEKVQCFTDGPQWEQRGERWWTTYRYQLEAFVEMCRTADSKAKDGDAGEVSAKVPWVTLDESVKVMELIDMVYEKAGLPKRGL